MHTFVLSLTTAITKRLRWLTPFQIVTYLWPRLLTYGFVDLWVLAHLIGAVAIWLSISTSPWWSVAVLYGGLRVYEVILYSVEILLGVKPDKTPRRGNQPQLKSIRRSVLLALLNYLEIVVWFAAFYHHFANMFESPELAATRTGALYFSVLTMSTYGDIRPLSDCARWMVIIHLSIAVYFTLFVLGRFIAALPRPKSLDPDEQENKEDWRRRLRHARQSRLRRLRD